MTLCRTSSLWHIRQRGSTGSPLMRVANSLNGAVSVWTSLLRCRIDARLGVAGAASSAIVAAIFGAGSGQELKGIAPLSARHPAWVAGRPSLTVIMRLPVEELYSERITPFLLQQFCSRHVVADQRCHSIRPLLATARED